MDKLQLFLHLFAVTTYLSCNNISILHRFQNITSFTVYMIAYNLEKSFSFSKTAEITGHVHSPIYM